jgi:predicted PurR-regulated permease PerM
MFNPTHKIDISFKTIVYTIFLILGLFVIYQIRLVLLLVFLAYLIMTAFNTFVTKMENYKIPRVVSGLLAYFTVIALISSFFALIIPSLIDQVSVLSSFIAKQLQNSQLITIDENFIVSQIENITKSFFNIVKFLTGAFSNILVVTTLLFMSFFMLLERKHLPKYIKDGIKDSKQAKKLIDTVLDIEKQLGGWIRGELTLMLIIGMMSYVGLSLLKVPFALPLAIIAGLLEIVPSLGPTLSSIPAIITGFTVSWPIGIAVLVLYILVQQIENSFVVPMVMQKAVNLKPLISILCLMIGVTLGGIGGAVLAIPIFLTARSIYVQYRHNA